MGGRRVKVAGANGSLEVLEPHDNIPLSGDEVVDIRGSPNLRADVQIAGKNEVIVKSKSVESARIDGQEIVPTNLEENKSLVFSVLLGGLGLLWATLQLANFAHQRTKGER
jgi:hypothetical protein